MIRYIGAYVSALFAYIGTYVVISIIEYYISTIPIIGAFLFYPRYGYSEMGYQAYIFSFFIATLVSYKIISLFTEVIYPRIIAATAITIIIIGFLNLLWPVRAEDDIFLQMLFILSGGIYWCLTGILSKVKKKN